MLWGREGHAQEKITLLQQQRKKKKKVIVNDCLHLMTSKLNYKPHYDA